MAEQHRKSPTELNRVNEMATIFNIDKLIGIHVYSDDHDPPHFHLGIRGGASIRIAIPNTPFETQEQVKALTFEKDKHLIPTYQKYFKDLIKLLKQPKTKQSQYSTALAFMQDVWCSIHNIDDTVFKDVNDKL